jgi:DNA polymerase delta subunit 1
MEDPDDFDGDVPEEEDDPSLLPATLIDEELYGDHAPPEKRARSGSEAASSSSSDHRSEFARYARPAVTVLPESFEFMLIDAECITAKIRNDMDDLSADHTPVLHADVRPFGRQKRHFADPFVMGPVIKLYGVCADETSVCVDIYGCYPSFRMQIVRGTPSPQCLERVRSYAEKTVLCPKSGIQPDKPRNIVSASMVRAFSAFPYRAEPSIFYEFKLARPHSVRAMAEHFAKVVEFDDDYSEGGVLGFVPHSGEDALTQYVVGSGVSGFGWVSSSSLENPSDSYRLESEASTCNYAGDCRKDSVRSIDGNDSMAPLRVLGIDIECIKNEGMPDPLKQPIIIIGAVACKALNGVIDPASMQNVVFTWFPPGSGGVDEIPSVHQVVAVDNEIEMMRAFGAFMTTYDPDIIVGHNIVGFDIPYIVTRANTLGVEEAMYMGRRHDSKWSAPREITRMRKNGDTRKSLRAETPGRVQLDTLPFMQGAKKESSYRLGALAQKYLGEGKDDVGYQMINPLWRQSPQTRARLCSYCLKDVQLSLGLAMHKEFEMVLSVIELSRSTRVRAPQLLRSGNQEKVKTLVLHAAKTPHFDAENLPVFFPYETPKPRSKDDKFKGATVINPKRGARKKSEPVAVGDFRFVFVCVWHKICFFILYNKLHFLCRRPF